LDAGSDEAKVLRVRVSAIALLILFAAAQSAGAVSLTLGGSGAAQDAAQALWASNPSGQSVLITAIGGRAPDGLTFSEIGVPSMAPDGRVWFGAEETGPDRVARWNVFVGDPEATPARRVAFALGSVRTKAGSCLPHFHTDPFPVADSAGRIAFMAADADGRDTLFLSSDGALSCLAAVGSETSKGHRISILSHGTVGIGDDGEVVFSGWLKDNADSRNERQALFLASLKAGVVELAVEGELGPNRTLYRRPFGLPAVLASAEGTLVAFTAGTESGSALFLYRGGVMARVLPTGTLTGIGPVSYLSSGRPGLMSDGTTALLAGCAKIPAIFRLERGRLDLRIQRGQLTPFGTELESLGDPILTRSGAMMVGATDSQEHEKLYVLDFDNALFEVGGTSMLYKISLGGDRDEHSIFTGTLTANQRGDFAYLGGK
jgi:hypothetical protein